MLFSVNILGLDTSYMQAELRSRTARNSNATMEISQTVGDTVLLK